MVSSEKKSVLQSKAINTNQKISQALLQVNQALNFHETFGEDALKKAVRNYVEQLSIPDLKYELIDSLCKVEVAAKKIEIYEAALAMIEVANVAEMSRHKGGRPKNLWAEVAYKQAKQHLEEKGRLPTAKLLSNTVCKVALSKGYSEPSSGKEVFSVTTAKDYLGYFKKSLPLFKLLTAEQWFSLFDGDFAATKYFGENLFPP